ncbi:clamp loader of DNA polymerase [Bacillus phage G]|uniref:Gp70 n=1 Tax=Bacillus phage G TaxID=2884420 RepID=G3MBE0_9CAUD|nr:clamp loader of DNA polymerase [Bacillus phage G]AEO93341.1 gp70 [Bacillus phage G]
MKQKPLAHRMRPESLSEFIGQKHILGEGMLLRKAIEKDMLRSIIFYGPPACGKTSLAYVISKTTKSIFVQLNAVTAKKSDIMDVIDQAKKMEIGMGKKTILFLDEIHRFNKGQQDSLLPYVEDGTITLIGATTENPFFEINGALISRSTIFKLEPLSKKDIRDALVVAIDKEYSDVNADLDALEHIADVANGDLRAAYNSLELAVLMSEPSEKSVADSDKLLKRITLQIVEESSQKRAINYGKGDSNHYDIMSAFSKSMRGSDSTAALHWFARMLQAGEDPKAIMRRVMTHAAEDVGLANPQALVVATSAMTALEFTGMPEARIPMSQAIIYICESPKSNAVYRAIDRAINDVNNKELGEVPLSLRDTHYKGAKDFGHGEGYIYPHNIPGNWLPQQYAPDNIHGSDYYKPTNNGFEIKVKELRKRREDNYAKYKGHYEDKKE